MATRPLFLVYQEFATLTTTPATPELNCLIGGAAYWIQDFPEDRSNIQSATNYGALNAAATGASVAPVADTDEVSLADAPNNKVGAVLDGDSVRVFFGTPRVELANGSDGVSAADSSTYTSASATFVTDGVAAGDFLIVTDATPSTKVMRIRSVTDENTLVLTDEFQAVGFDTYRIERELADTEIDASFISVTAGTNAITVKGGVTLAVGGVQKPVSYATVFVAYRSLRQDLADVGTINSILDIKGALGRIDARNPLAAGLFVGLSNSNTPLQYFGVPSEDLAGFLSMRDAISSRNDVYAVVPLSAELSVISAFNSAHVNMADPDYALTNGVPQKFRVVIGGGIALPITKTISEGSANGAIVAAAGGGFDFTDAGATFVSDGVIPTDLVKVGITTYTVETVVSNQRLHLVDDALTPAAGLTYEVSRTLDKNGQVDALVATTQSLTSRRAVLCWPDLVDVKDLVDGSLPRSLAAPSAPVMASSQPGYYLACAVGAMTAGLPSHQGFTNLGISAISKLYHSNKYFDDAQITKLSNGGWFVFQQDAPAALPYIVHQLTTDPSALETGEFSMVKNFDYVSLSYGDVLDGFIGPWNINEETIGFIRNALVVNTETLQMNRRPKIGARIKDATLTSLGTSSISEDRLEAYVEVDFPKPLNTVGLHIVSK